MKSVSPRRWTALVDRSQWIEGPWTSELYDRAQWTDRGTGYHCLAIRSDMGVWCGYVGIPPEHPLYGGDVENAPINASYSGPTDDHHYIEPDPPSEFATIDENDPRSALDVISLRPLLWFYGFDCGHHNDINPMSESMFARTGLSLKFPADRKPVPTYKDLDHVVDRCADLAKTLKHFDGRARPED